MYGASAALCLQLQQLIQQVVAGGYAWVAATRRWLRKRLLHAKVGLFCLLHLVVQEPHRIWREGWCATQHLMNDWGVL
jgi:hypothetical protein